MRPTTDDVLSGVLSDRLVGLQGKTKQKWTILKLDQTGMVMHVIIYIRTHSLI